MPDGSTARSRRALHLPRARGAQWPLLSLLLPLRIAAAQVAPAAPPLLEIEDARVLPRGTVRLRGLNVWSRFDEVFGGDSTGRVRALAAGLNLPALGARQLPALVPAQDALRTLTGDRSLALSLGQLVGTADSRIVTTPLILEYGVSRRLTLGVTVPIVETRTTLFVELNPRGTLLGPSGSRFSTANVGPNPARALQGSAAQQMNQKVHAEIEGAMAQLQTALQSCATNPSGSICTRQAEAQQLLQTSGAVAQALVTLYGIDAQSGSSFAPYGSAAAAVDARLAALDQQYQSLLGQGSYVADRPVAAHGRAALRQLQGFGTGPGIGLDSVGSPGRIGIGDVEVRAAYQLLDTFADTTRPARSPRLRATVQGGLRLGTGRPASGRVPFDIGAGMGQTGIDGAFVLDARPLPRVVGTVLGRYTAFVGGAAVSRIPGSEYAIFPVDTTGGGRWRPGNILDLGLAPRYLLTDWFSVSGYYALRHQGAASFTTAQPLVSPPGFAATTEHRLGLGFEYSTLARYARGRTSVPLELSFTHSQTVVASGGLVPRLFQDQIEARIYYSLRRGGR